MINVVNSKDFINNLKFDLVFKVPLMLILLS